MSWEKIIDLDDLNDILSSTVCPQQCDLTDLNENLKIEEIVEKDSQTPVMSWEKIIDLNDLNKPQKPQRESCNINTTALATSNSTKW